ncbi:MFS transporter [Brevibacillus sp. 179-C9.3 HS]|uniref:MFS transporter n=1 Tax=unclassified Brevibacillus TaxID=2684853 RepID=UPI0039A3BFAD
MNPWFPSISTYKRTVKLILLWNLIFCLGQSVYLVLYNLYLNEFVPEYEIGQIVGLGYLSYAGFSLLGGILSDRIGPRKTLIMGIFFLASGYGGGSLAESSDFLYFWSIVTGLGQACTMAMFVPVLTEYSDREDRMRLFSIAYGSGTFALFAGTLLAGLVTDSFQQFLSFSGIASMRITVLFAASFVLLSVIPLLLVKTNTSSMESKLISPEHSEVEKRRVYIPVSLYGMTRFMEGMGVGLIMPFVNLFLVGRFELGTTMISVVMSIATLGTVFMMFLTPIISRKLGEVKLLVIYQMIGLPTLILLSFTTNLWVAALCFLFFRTMYYSTLPIQSKVIMDIIDKSRKGLVSSVGLMSNTIGIGLVSPLSMNLVADFGNYWGYVYSFILSFICLVVSVTSFYWFFERNRERLIVVHNRTKKEHMDQYNCQE